MKRFLTPLPIGIVLADLIYGFVLNVMQGLNLQQTALFSCAMISCQAPMWLFAATYMEKVRSSMGDQYVEGVQTFMPPWMGFAAIGILFVSSLLGALLGRRMLKKHFERAGIV